MSDKRKKVLNVLTFFKTRKRDRLDIIAQIRELVKSGMLRTQIMYRANLSFRQLDESVNYLARIGALTLANVDGKDKLLITEKGLDFCQQYIEMTSLLRDYSGKPVCSSCDRILEFDYKFCPYCGKLLDVHVGMPALNAEFAQVVVQA